VDRRASLYRGSELPRLLVLLGIVAVGWPAAVFMATRPARQPEPARTVETVELPPGESSPEFQAVEDRARLSFRETAAYARLLEQARQAAPAKLAASSARHVMYSQLWERPQRYRGVPIHVEGWARRVLVHDEMNPALAPGGKIFEAWVFTSESQNNPYVLVFDQPPAGFPVGDKLEERVAFDGYFFKLLAYQAGDVARAAPMLVGRLRWIRSPQTTERDQDREALWWLFGGMSVLTALAFLRWGLYLKRNLLAAGPASEASTRLAKPTEEISPQDLARWLNTSEDEPEAEEPR
jgi:hypothetical protein